MFIPKEMSSDSKSKAHVHAARISFNWGIDEFFKLGKGHYLVKFSCNLIPVHSENGSIKVNILMPCQFWVKTCANF